MGDAQATLHRCELCGAGEMPEAEMRTHMLLVHVEENQEMFDPGSQGWSGKESIITPESDDGHYLESGRSDFGSLWELERDAGEGISGDFSSSPRSPGDFLPGAMEDETDGSQSEDEDPSTLQPSLHLTTTSSSEVKRPRSSLSLALERPTGGCSTATRPFSPSSSSSSSRVLSPSSSALLASLPCPLCPFTSPDPVQLEIHVNRAHLDDLSPAVQSAGLVQPDKISSEGCPLCPASFPNAAALQSHFAAHHAPDLSPSVQPKRPENGNTYRRDSNGNCSSSSRCCPVCGQEFKAADQAGLEAHVDAHFAGHASADLILAQEMQRREEEALRWHEAQEFAALQAQYGMRQDDQGNFAAQTDTGMRRAVARGQLSVTDFHEQTAVARLSALTGLDDGSSRTAKVSVMLASLSAKSPGVCVTHLVSPPADHFAAAFGDRGWGCGYRNMQMLFSSLLASSLYRDLVAEALLPAGSINSRTAGGGGSGGPVPIPSIPRLQAAIESAWRQGFDRAGADQLGNRLTDTRKWIGATEVYTLLTSCGLDVVIVDFHEAKEEGGTHPLLFDWVWNYFSRRTTAGFATTQMTGALRQLAGSAYRPPLYLQHQGHSRTVVGVERLNRGDLKLLVLDPSTSPKTIRNHSLTMRHVRQSIANMRDKQYQVVAVVGILSEQEKEARRIKPIQSIRIPS